MKFVALSSLFLSFACFFTLSAQELDSATLQRIGMVESMLYHTGQRVFATPNLDISKIDEDFIPAWDNPNAYTTESLNEAIGLMIKDMNAVVDTGFFDKLQVRLTSRFPNDFDANAAGCEISVEDVQLKDAGSNELTFTVTNTNFGSYSNSGIKDGKSYQESYNTLNTTLTFRKAPQGKPKGTLELKVRFPVQYEHISLRADQVGKTSNFADSKISLLKVDGTRAILHIEGDQTKDFEYTNLTKDGKGLSLDFAKRPKGHMGGSSKSVIDAKVAEIFMANPQISEEAFSTAIHDHILAKISKEQGIDKKVAVIQSVGNIQQLVLYRPSEWVERSFTVELK